MLSDCIVFIIQWHSYQTSALLVVVKGFINCELGAFTVKWSLHGEKGLSLWKGSFIVKGGIHSERGLSLWKGGFTVTGFFMVKGSFAVIGIFHGERRHSQWKWFFLLNWEIHNERGISLWKRAFTVKEVFLGERGICSERGLPEYKPVGLSWVFHGTISLLQWKEFVTSGFFCTTGGQPANLMRPWSSNSTLTWWIPNRLPNLKKADFTTIKMSAF